MKKIILSILIMAMAVSVAGCGLEVDKDSLIVLDTIDSQMQNEASNSSTASSQSSTEVSGSGQSMVAPQDGSSFEDGVPELGIYVELPEFYFDPKDYSPLDDVKVDIDLVESSVIFSYAQVVQMMYNANEYIGQSVKMKGTYYQQVIPEYDITLHLIIMLDETNCCQGFLEFYLLDETLEYPQSGEEIMIVGEYVFAEDATGIFPRIDVSTII